MYQNTPRCYRDLQKNPLLFALPSWKENQLPFFPSPCSYQANNRNIHSSFFKNVITHSSLSSCLPYSRTKLAWAQGALSAEDAIPVGKWFCSSEWNSMNFPIINPSFQGSWRSWSSTQQTINSTLAWVWFRSSSATSTPRIQTCPCPLRKRRNSEVCSSQFWTLRRILQQTPNKTKFRP